MHQKTFQKNGFVTLKNLLRPEIIQLLQMQFKLMEQTTYHLNDIDINDKHRFSDPLVGHSFTFYNAHCFEALLPLLQEKVEQVVEKKLYPTYSYGRIMYAGASMPKHTDRESCEFSISLCISEDKANPYPLWIEDFSGQPHSLHLTPGDMVLYKGRELHHWRDVYQGQEQMQTFLHYVDVDGPYAHQKFDKRVQLGLPHYEMADGLYDTWRFEKKVAMGLAKC